MLVFLPCFHFFCFKQYSAFLVYSCCRTLGSCLNFPTYNYECIFFSTEKIDLSSLIHVVLWVSFSFRISIQRKELKKTIACGNSRTRSSISPIRLDCSIRVYLNFALRKQEKLNNLLPQLFCVYTNRHLIDTYSSF